MITIVICVGQLEYFEKLKLTLDSIMQQSKSECVELIIKVYKTHLQNSIEAYRRANSNLNIKLLTGCDLGIYDAHNISINNASGEYLLILGCGDILADKFVISDLIDFIYEKKMPLIIYGVVIFSLEDGKTIGLFDNSCFIENKHKYPWHNPCHSQGLVYNLKWLKSRPFNTNFGLISDLIHTHTHKVYDVAAWINRPLSIFMLGGISNQINYSSFNKRLKSIYLNCDNFRFPIFFKTVSFFLCWVNFIFLNIKSKISLYN